MRPFRYLSDFFKSFLNIFLFFSPIRMAAFFTHEVFFLLLRKKLIGLPMVEKILRWRHTGFNVHSQVRAQTRSEAERVGKYMIRPLLSLNRFFFDETTGKVLYQSSRQGSQEERMDYLEFIARVTSHIPDKGQVTFGGGIDFPLPTVALDFRLCFLPPLLGQGLWSVLRPKGHTPVESPDCFVLYKAVWSVTTASTPMPTGGRCVRLRLILLITPSLKMSHSMFLPRSGPR